MLEDHLKRHFGYNEFRSNQKEIVSAILERKDVVAILPTGAGKSICYQLPALLLPGLTIVISPLISLMQDQVISLSKNGLPAAFLNSSLPYSEIQAVLEDLSLYKLLYVAPERFSDENFVQSLKRVTVSLFAIDEAHCISQWGHSFRPEYRQLASLKKTFPGSSLIALTATATKDVEIDIVAQLAMEDPHRVRASFDRPNLTVHIEPKTTPLAQLRDFFRKHSGQSGIVYAATRKGVDEIFESLKEEGEKLCGGTVGKYHAGMTDSERMKAQHDFLHGDCLLMIATVAFGMGVHKPDIRFIVHVDMPRSIEQYYQEIGRAGRDGLPSECFLLYSTKELVIYDLFLKDLTDETVRKRTKLKTDQMLSLCRSSQCRRKGILRYFGEEYSLENCNSCDRCLDQTDFLDETISAQKILSCVFRLGHQFGVKHVIDVLRGAKTKSIFEKGHDRLSTYQLMADSSEEELRFLINVLIEKGFLDRSEGEYPVLRWTDRSSLLIQGGEKLLIQRKRERSVSLKKERETLEVNQQIFDQLSQLRKRLAREQNVPAFVIFGDKTLQEMARLRPQTSEEMWKINGVGPIKWHKYGQQFLSLLRKN